MNLFVESISNPFFGCALLLWLGCLTNFWIKITKIHGYLHKKEVVISFIGSITLYLLTAVFLTWATKYDEETISTPPAVEKQAETGHSTQQGAAK